MKRISIRRLAASLLVAVACSAAVFLGLLYQPDNMLNDALYQQPQALSGEIILVGIDERAMERFGPTQTWSREIMASALERLNSDPDNLPAAIGVDVLYVGESDAAADARLVEAAALQDNVVMASFADIGSALVTLPDGGFYMEQNAVLSYNAPFPALQGVVRIGHINAMHDSDGVLRQAMSVLSLPEEAVPSFNAELYRLYAEAHGRDMNTPPVDASGRWLVHYSALPGGYSDNISLTQLIDGEIPAAFFAGKVVLIGPYAPGLMDYVYTPVDRATLMYGVEFQANAIDAQIRENYKIPVLDILQAILVFLLAGGCMWWFWGRRVLPITLVWLVVGGGWIALCVLLYHAGFVLHTLWVSLPVTVVYIGSVATNYVRASLEKRQVIGTFKRYVAPEVVNKILKEGTSALGLGGKTIDIAVLFVDIRGFTPMSEALEPEQVVGILNRYLTLTSGCILHNGGMLDKFMGDATMAIWGAPLPQQDYVFKAVKTALDMVEQGQGLRQELQQRYGRTVDFGIGVHCGKAVVGNIGAQIRMDYTAIGDTVNTAARLEANAPGGSILVSRKVADALQGRIVATPLQETVTLKGKREEVEVFRVEGLV